MFQIPSAMLKKIFWIFITVLIAIQFIKPAHNEGAIEGPGFISNVVPVSAEVEDLFVKACFDCHSNNTYYPWYSKIQPVAWFMAHHVDEGRGHLNFSEFASYDAKKQDHKLEEVIDAMKEGWMPLDSYTWMHSEAKLTQAERETIVAWAVESRKQIQ